MEDCYYGLRFVRLSSAPRRYPIVSTLLVLVDLIQPQRPAIRLLAQLPLASLPSACKRCMEDLSRCTVSMGMECRERDGLHERVTELMHKS